jgi:hypothetical protein
MYLFIYYLFIYSFIYLFIYLFIIYVCINPLRCIHNFCLTSVIFIPRKFIHFGLYACIVTALLSNVYAYHLVLNLHTASGYWLVNY